MSAKIPAWQRLGLKLKSPASGSEIGGPAPADGSKPNGQHHHDRPVVNAANASAAAAAKRKRPEHSSAPPAFSSPLKRTRTDGHAATPPTLRKQKSVTFADDTKKPAAAAGAADPTKTKKKSKKAKPVVQPQQADIKPSLEYLRNWKHARQAWKFNKNNQTILMKRAFQADQIPSSDIGTFYEYIRDLKGHTRTRLRETAAEVKKEDAAKGAAGFPEGTPNMDSKQSEYEKVLAGLMQLGSDGSAAKRKRFDEPGFVSQSSDVAVTQRVIKRMRAETILDELADSEDSDAMTIDTEETANTSQAAAPAAREEEEQPVDKGAKLDERTRRRLQRKKRVTADDSSSDESSDDDSDDDDTSSSGSSSDDSDNESEVQRQAAQRDAETSSSSSSSSEDEDDSNDDDSSDEEENTKKPAGKR